MSLYIRVSTFALLILTVCCFAGCPATYTVTTSVIGDGTVTLDPPGGAYQAGTTVTITPVAAADWVFHHWEGTLTSNPNPGVIVVNANTDVTAVFTTETDAGAVVIIPDTGLEHAMRAAIEKPEGDIYRFELLRLTLFNGSGYDIKNLEGLQYCKNLTELYLISNLIDDLSPISGLTGLTTLLLTYNNILDVTPLGALVNLVELDVANNLIGNIDSFASLTKLERLYLFNNQVTDLTPLTGLANLQTLKLANNPILEIGPLVTNAGIGTNDEIDLRDALLAMTACDDIFTLLERGADVTHDLLCEGEPGCPVDTKVDGEGEDVYSAISTEDPPFDWYKTDLDDNGIPDNWEAAIVSEVLCDRDGPLYDAVRNAYQASQAIITTEEAYSLVFQNYDHVFINLSLISAGLFDALKTQVNEAAPGILNNDYTPYTSGGIEILSAIGDLDGDGQTNLEEYNRIIAEGGYRSDYVDAVLTYDAP